MTFSEFLKSKLNLIIWFLVINAFALFVNIFEIKGNIREKDSSYNSYSENIDLFTQGFNDDSKSKFWPFVDYTQGWVRWDDSQYNPGPRKNSTRFYGIFNQYDYSEFLAYCLILLLILYFYWNNKKNKPLQKKKSKIKNAFWADLINGFKEKGIITNGLTIPYLIGFLNSRYRLKTNKETLEQLVDNLIDSNSLSKPVLQFCSDINEYVISTANEDFCEKNFQNEISFRNVANVKTLYITQNASKFGTTKEELVNNIWAKYGDKIEHKLFSWKSLNQQWYPFDDVELRRIWEIM